jgi:S1-C subfamily serine protease
VTTVEEERRRIYTVIAIVALAMLILSCAAGALAGGIAGFVAGRRQARAVADQALQGQLEERIQLRQELRERLREDLELPQRDPQGTQPPVEGFMPEMQGAIVREVIEGTPADQAGLEPGDIIVRVDSIPIDLHHELPDVIQQYWPGDVVTLSVVRAGEVESVRVKLGEHPEEPGRAYLGIYFETLSESPRLDFDSD